MNKGASRWFDNVSTYDTRIIEWVNFEFQLDKLCGCDYEEVP
jgi:hypothetical protein